MTFENHVTHIVVSIQYSDYSNHIEKVEILMVIAVYNFAYQGVNGVYIVMTEILFYFTYLITLPC